MTVNTASSPSVTGVAFGTTVTVGSTVRIVGPSLKVVPVTGSDHALDPSAFVASTCTW